MKIIRYLLILICVVLCSCTTLPHKAYESGQASWYGSQFQGRKTASGEKFDMNAMTAAHPTLPFGSRVRVVNPENGASVVVRINDRGPFTRDRIIDLSKAAAQKLGIVAKGFGTVLLYID